MMRLGGHPLATTGDWSSVIGIVTAVIGNILISFALNTQRYAHVRLSKEQESEEAELASPKNSSKRSNGGAVQEEEEIAAQRQRANAADVLRSRLTRESLDGSDEEREALIPRINGRGSPKKELTNGHGYNESDDEGDDNDDADSTHTIRAKRKSYIRSPYWWLGIVLMVIGEAGNFLAYGFAPASIVSPLGVVALVSNCLVAPCMLHEQFRRRDLLGVVIAIGGAVTVVLSAEGSNPKLGPDEIFDLVKRWEFLTYMGITVGLIFVFMALSSRYGQKTIVIDVGLVGLLGGYTALSTKGVASLLSYRLWFVFTFPIFYVLVTILVVTAVLQIKYVNRALQRFDSTRVIPAQFCSFTIFVIAGSAVLYRDFESTTKEKVGMFLGGCALTFLGVWLLTSARRDNDGSNDDQLQDEEEGIDLVDDDASQHTADPTTPTPKARRDLSAANSTGQTFRSAVSRLQQTPTPPPRLVATESSPLLPTSAASSSSPAAWLSADSSRTSVATTGSSRLAPPAPHAGASPSLGPAANAHARRRSLAGRASLAHIDLAPLTSPLSSGLSVVVADQRGRMRRGSSLREHRRSLALDGRAAPNARLLSASVPGGVEGDGPGAGVVSQRPRVGRGTTGEIATTAPDQVNDPPPPQQQRSQSDARR